MKKVKFLFFIIITSCWNKEIDYSIVKIGKYPYTTKQLKEKNKILFLRKKIEKEFNSFADIVQHFYPDEKKKVEFEYKYTAFHNDKIILKYFAPIYYDKLYAGYLLQFVVKNNAIIEIYLFKVPLE